MNPEPSQRISAPLRVVLDTNVVMDLLHFLDPRTLALKNALAQGNVYCYSNAACLGELERVMNYPEFGLGEENRSHLMQAYLGFVIACEAHQEELPPLPRCRDADDQKFLELAAHCSADMLLTRDKQLLRLARHRHKPPPFAILTAEDAGRLLEFPAKHPAQSVRGVGVESVTFRAESL